MKTRHDLKTLLTLVIAGGLTLLAFAAFGATRTDGQEKAVGVTAQVRTAIFAGGCFWCMEPPFESLDGVLAVTSGYTGGSVVNPTYEQVSGGGTGHAEAVQVTYDPARVSYQKLLDVFWRNIDPTDGTGQFIDRGNQYRAAIFYVDDDQRQLAEASKQALEASKRFSGLFSTGRIVTEITPAGPFYPAEEYHQDYYKKNALRYQYYRWNSGRDQFLKRAWGESGH
jgi:methionine-S-sulfoxide reductase